MKNKSNNQTNSEKSTDNSSVSARQPVSCQKLLLVLSILLLVILISIETFGFQMGSINLIMRIRESTDRNMDETRHLLTIYLESLRPYTCIIQRMTI